MKKYQYIFYKHFLLHGLNVTVALDGIQIARRNDFRMYWLCLNISYVMEFFFANLGKEEVHETIPYDKFTAALNVG